MDLRLPPILCVDDEPKVVEGLTLHLKRDYRVMSAHSGAAALDLLKLHGAPAVIVADMRMPVMDGATLLKHARHLYPETTRILLTGETGRDAAISAVNDGQIFRFLTKPCPLEQLRKAVEDGVAHHRVLNAEKVLLQETLIGCIQALMDVLAITNPVAFGRAARVKRLATDLARAAGYPGFWQLEAAAMLSELGYVSLPVELVEKLYYGKWLTAEERALADGAPRVAQKLLGRIPRLEPVMEILAASEADAEEQGGDTIKLGARILRLVRAYDAQLAQGHSVDVAVRAVRAPHHDSALLSQLESLVGSSSACQEVSELAVGRVKSGMVFMDDLRTPLGALLVPKGFEVTDAFMERMRNFGPSILEKRVRVGGAAR